MYRTRNGQFYKKMPMRKSGIGIRCKKENVLQRL